MIVEVTEKNIKIQKEDKEFIQEVIGYYTSFGRDTLPWRNTITPYKVLVSEIMLQQTQVSRVIPKFKIWMQTYPTLQSLAKSSLQDVLILWQGLGYQRRAKALVLIASQVRTIPKRFEELLGLSGVGVYTASAVGAFAYNQFLHPVLETNIRTALIESFHQGEGNIHDGVLYDDLTRLEKYKDVIELGARKWYYALMDYGAYLKEQNISHNKKSFHYTKQSAYKGSRRELRAKVLYAVAHKDLLPNDERVAGILEELTKEGFLVIEKSKYTIATLQ